MVKSVIKEIFIILLLVVSIVLILTILFYNYRPSAKKVPANVGQYTLPEDVQQELDEKLLETQNIVKTYKVDSDDLYKYEKSNDYDKGKNNPFEAINTSETPQNVLDGLFNSVK